MTRSHRPHWRRRLIIGLALAPLTLGCQDDPAYVEEPDNVLEIDPATVDPELPPELVQVDLPVEVETTEEMERRLALADELGVEVPVVSRADVALSVEWLVENLDEDGPAAVTVFMNGASEYFRFDPDAFVIDPDEDESPPNLIDGLPIEVPPGGTISGVFREDELDEAAFDLDWITRGAANPFMALLQDNGDDDSFVSTADGLEYPEEAIASLVRFELGMQTNRHARLTFAVRVRDKAGVLHDELLRAPDGELIVFAPADFVPMLPPM